jgi:hypothetical protein
MPEQQTDTATEAAETAAPEGTENQETAPKPTETVEFWKAKAREQEKRAKENAAKASQFDQLTEAAKTELERAQERAEMAEREAATLKAEKEISGWKAQVAKSTGLPADVLRGATLEEIEEHAASLKSLLPEPRKPGHVPAEGRSVATGSGDPAQQLASIIKAQLRG